MNLAIKNIANYVKWKNVKRAIRYHYPTDHNNYEKLFYRLQTMPYARVAKDEFLEIYGGLDLSQEYYGIGKHLDEFLEQLKTGYESLYYSIHMIKPNNDKDHQTWAISFIPWRKLANMPISYDTLKHYTFEDILAHFIWEITYYGNEKQMNVHKKEIFRRVKSLKSQKGSVKTLPSLTEYEKTINK